MNRGRWLLSEQEVNGKIAQLIETWSAAANKAAASVQAARDTKTPATIRAAEDALDACRHVANELALAVTEAVAIDGYRLTKPDAE